MTAATDEHERAPAAPCARLGLRCFLAAVGGAAATGLATPPVSLAWLQWPALVLVLRALRGLSVRHAALVGFALGLGINVSLFTWLGVATARMGRLPLAAGLALFVAWAAFASLQFALVGALDAATSSRWPALRRALIPCAFVAGETVWPAVIPWTIGLPQLACAPLAQVAEWGGAALLTFVVVGGAAGLDAGLDLARAAVTRRPPPARDLVDAAWALLLLAPSLALGATRIDALRRATGERARVAIVQPGIVSNSLTPRSPDEVQHALERVAREVGAAGAVDLAVFPEAAAARRLIEVVDAAPDSTSATAGALRAEARRGRDDLARLARLCGCPTLIGLTAIRVAPGETVDTSRIVERRNAAALLDADGAIVDRYDKHTLLVVAEHLPGEATLPWLRAVAPFAGRYTPGPGPRRLRAGALSIAPLICFEAVPGEPARAALTDDGGAPERARAGLAGPAASRSPEDTPPRETGERSRRTHHTDRPADVQLLVNLTNDVWFPGQGPHLHALAASLRAIETRRSLVRATTTGLSFAVLPDGRRVAEAPLGVPSVQVVDLPLGGGLTVYSKIGYTFGWLITTSSLLLAVASRVIRRPVAQQANAQFP